MLTAFVPPALAPPVAIALGAVLGALGRYYLTLAGQRWRGRDFPYGTLFVNLTGALLIGVVTGGTAPPRLSPEVQALVITGLLGAYTTFSSYILDAVNLWQSGRPSLAVAYGGGSILLGLGMVALGSWLAGGP